MAPKSTPAKKRAPIRHKEPPKPSYRVAATRSGARSVAGHYPAEHVQAFRALAAAQDKDVQQLLAEGINHIFECYGVALRLPIVSGRRTRQHFVTE